MKLELTGEERVQLTRFLATIDNLGIDGLLRVMSLTEILSADSLLEVLPTGEEVYALGARDKEIELDLNKGDVDFLYEKIVSCKKYIGSAAKIIIPLKNKIEEARSRPKEDKE